MLSKNNFDEKLKQMNKKSDKFSIRKLTIGAASVLIGTVFYLNNGGNVVQAADDVPNQPATQVEKNINQKTVGKVSTDTATSTLKADNTQQDNVVKVNTSVSPESEINSSKIVVNKDAREKTANLNEVGLQGIKDKSKESLPASALRTIKVEKTDSKQVNGQDVSNKLEDVKTNITDSKGKALEDNQNVEPENGDILRANYSFKLPNDSVKSGDGFKIHFSDNLNLYGTTDPNFMNNHAHEEGRSIPDLMDQDGDIIATTSNIDGKEDISASLSIPVFIDPKNVPNDSQQELETNIGSKTYSKDVNVNDRTFNNDIQSEN